MRGHALLRKAECYIVGFGVEEDIAKALQCFTASSNKGFLPSALCLPRLMSAHTDLSPRGSNASLLDQGSPSLPSGVDSTVRDIALQSATLPAKGYYCAWLRLVQNLMLACFQGIVTRGAQQVLSDLSTDFLAIDYLSRGLLMDVPSGWPEIHEIHETYESLHFAVLSNDAILLQSITTEHPELITKTDVMGRTALLKACMSSKASSVFLILRTEQGQDSTRITDAKGHAPFHFLNRFASSDQ